MKNTGPITKNGVHPITHGKDKVEPYGVSGSARAYPPKASQMTAKKEDAAPITKPKSAAELMYPKPPTLRGQG